MTKPALTLKLASDATGTDVSFASVGGIIAQATVEVDADGHVIGSRPEWITYFEPAANATSRVVASLFNGTASDVLRVRGLWIIPSLTAITGVNIGWDVNRISTVETGGTAATPRPLDTSSPPLPAGVDARFSSTAGGTLNAKLFSVFCLNDETNAGASLLAYQNQLPTFGDRISEIVLRPGQGIQIKQSVAASVGLTGAMINFVIDN